MKQPALYLFVGVLLSCGSPIREELNSASTSAPLEASEAPGDVVFSPRRRPDLPEEALAEIRSRENERAQRALAEVDSRFRERSPGLTFRIHRVKTTSLGDTHVLVQQVYRGIPVEQRDLLVIVHDDDHIRIIGSPDRFETVTLPSRRSLTRARAWAAERGVELQGYGERWLVPVLERRLRPGRQDLNAEDWETVVARFESGTRISIKGGPGYRGPRELFVRDVDGELVERGLPASAWAVADLRGLYARTNSRIETEADKQSFCLIDTWQNSVIHHGSHVIYCDSDNIWGDYRPYSPIILGSPPNDDTAAADAMISLWANAQMYKDVYGESTIPPVHAWIHMPSNNSFAYGDLKHGWNIELGYRDKNAMPLYPSTDIETVGHEVGHLMFDAKTGWYGAPILGEQGGLYEGSADIFGINASFYLPDALMPRPCNPICHPRKPLRITDDWEFANKDGPIARRSFIWPICDAWSSSLANVASHEAGGPLRLMYYFLSVGILPAGTAPSSSANNVPQRGSQYLPRGLAGIGVNAANDIWWHTLDGYYFTQVTDYATYRAVMLQATMTLYGLRIDTPEYKAVQDAWAAVNVGTPADRDPPAITISVNQTTPITAQVSVTVHPDPSGVVSGSVEIVSGLDPTLKVMESCTTSCMYPLNPSLWKEGPHEIRVKVTDGAGNPGFKVHPFRFDLTPPVITLTSKTTNPPTFPKQTWDFRAQDAGGLSSMKVMVHGHTIRSASWPTFYVPDETLTDVKVDLDQLGVPDGLQGVFFTATDNAGNVATRVVNLIQDNTGPEVCSLTSTTYSDPSYRVFTMTARDDGIGLATKRLYENGVGLIASFSSPAGSGVPHTGSWSQAFPVGMHTVHLGCTDKWGNYRSSQDITFIVPPPQPPPPPPACNTTATAGSNLEDQRTFEMGRSYGWVTLNFDTYLVPDRIRVFYENVLVADTGCYGSNGPSSLAFWYSGTSTKMTVHVSPNCASGWPTTEWEYKLSCPL